MDSIYLKMEQDNNCLSKSVLDPAILLEFALGYLMSGLNQFQVNSHFSWKLVKDGRGSGWLEKVKCCGYT